MRIVEVKITPEHIEKGGTGGGSCPTFLAMRDAGIPVDWVTKTAWERYNGGFGYEDESFELPEPVQEFIRNWDSFYDTYNTASTRHLAQPLTFTVELS